MWQNKTPTGHPFADLHDGLVRAATLQVIYQQYVMTFMATRGTIYSACGTPNALRKGRGEPLVRRKVSLARGASDELEPDGYLALTARLATM
jgi:hypothetical protein